MQNFYVAAGEIVRAPKTAVTTATATSGTGLATILDLIPDEIGKLASLVGVILSLMLIYVHIRKLRIEMKEGALRIEMLTREKEALDKKEAAESWR